MAALIVILISSLLVLAAVLGLIDAVVHLAARIAGRLRRGAVARRAGPGQIA